jgi:digeranylgeranylglycerophospholipid reductase
LNRSEYDIIIIGAGLAGLSAARSVLKTGKYTVALIEGETVGFNNPSPLTFSDTVSAYRLDDCIKEAYSGFRFHNYKGSSIDYCFAGQLLVVLDYKKACSKIFSSLGTKDGKLEYINRYAVGIEPNRASVGNMGCVELKLKDGKPVTAKLLIDASGRSQLSAGLLQGNSGYYSHVYGAFYSGVECPEQGTCSYLLPSSELGSGGGWFYPVGTGCASFGYAHITNSPVSDLKALKTIFHAAQEHFKPYADFLKNAKIEYMEKGVIPISYINRFVHDNMILVGDAAGMATNWTCMGVEPALKYGQLAGELAVKALSQNDPNILNQFRDIWEKDNKAAHDFSAKLAPQFWDSGHYFWEWIIKNDLAYLSPVQVLERMRYNSHLLKRHQLLFRVVMYKLKSILNKNTLKPGKFTINKDGNE